MRHFDYDKVVRPCFGQIVSGDTAVIREVEGGIFMGIVDVLGHGKEAHSLALIIESFLQRQRSANPIEVMNRLHLHVKGSRGAAVGLCFLDVASGELRYVGIGNTVIRKFGKNEVRLVSRDGVVGANMRTPREERMRLTYRDVVVLYTDGVRSHFKLEEYPQLLSDTARTIATIITQRFGKFHDDASCIALRYI